MILSFGLILMALAVLLVLLYVEGVHDSAVAGPDDLAGRTRPVDLEAFRNLVDPNEEDFLRTSLPKRQFRAVQRERLRAALSYIQNSAHNAGLLLRLGEAATRSGDPRVVQAGRELMDKAFRLRAYALLASMHLYLRMALPESRLSYGWVADSYQHLSLLAGQLVLMQHPSQATRLSTLL